MDESQENKEFELLSAYVDGEATSEERALIEKDAKLMKRAQELKSLSDGIGQILKNDPSTKATHIQAALKVAESGSSTPPTPINQAKSSSTLARKSSWILSAAAVIALVFIAIPIFQSDNSPSEQIATDTFERSDSEIESEALTSESIEESPNNTATTETDSSSTTPNQSEMSEPEPEQGESQKSTEEITGEETLSSLPEEEPSESVSNVQTSDEGIQALATVQGSISLGPINTYNINDANVFGNYLLEDVRIQTGEVFDTFIIELIATEDNPPSTLPGPYAIEINSEFLMEEDSYVLPAEISEYIVINLAARGGVWSDESGYEPSWGSFSQTITADGSNLTGIYFGDFEANLTFILGMEPNSTFRSYQTMDPPRLVIEVDHNP